MSNYLSVHICSPRVEHITTERNHRMAYIRFLNGDEDDIARFGGTSVSATFEPEDRDRLLRLRDACDEALALLDEIEREDAAQTTLEVAS